MKDLTSVKSTLAYHLYLLACCSGSSCENDKVSTVHQTVRYTSSHLLASHSDSSLGMSSSLPGPFTLAPMELSLSSKNSMQACVPPSRYFLHLPVGASTKLYGTIEHYTSKN